MIQPAHNHILAEGEPLPYPAEEYRVANTVSEPLFRQYFDPRGEFSNESILRLVDCVAATRAPVQLPRLGELTPYEVLLAQAVDLEITDGKGLPLPIKPDRQAKITKARLRYATDVAIATKIVIDSEIANWKTTNRRLGRSGRQIPKLPSKVMLAGKFLMYVGHDGQMRRDGSAFYSHPDSVTQLNRMALRRQYGGRRHQQMIDVHSFTSNTHDVSEDGITQDGSYLGYDPAAQLVVTPAVMSETLRRLRVRQAKKVGRAAFYMMRSHGIYGPEYVQKYGDDRMEYLRYVFRGAMVADLVVAALYVVAKFGDNKENGEIHPEIPAPGSKQASRIRRRQLQYVASKGLLLGVAARRLPKVVPVLQDIDQLTVHDVERSARNRYQFDAASKAREIRSQYVLRQTNAV